MKAVPGLRGCGRNLPGRRKILEAVTEETLEALNNGFRFMEEAFGDSQEMVVFVTELNTSAASIRFLKENDCDLYYRYNKKTAVRWAAAGNP